MAHPTLDHDAMDPLVESFEYRDWTVTFFLWPGAAHAEIYDGTAEYDVPLPWGGSPATWAGLILAAIRVHS